MKTLRAIGISLLLACTINNAYSQYQLNPPSLNLKAAKGETYRVMFDELDMVVRTYKGAGLAARLVYLENKYKNYIAILYAEKNASRRLTPGVYYVNTDGNMSFGISAIDNSFTDTELITAFKNKRSIVPVAY